MHAFCTLQVLLYAGELALLCPPDHALRCMLQMAELVLWDVQDIANPADVLLDFLTEQAPEGLQGVYSTLGSLLVALRSRARKDYDRELTMSVERDRRTATLGVSSESRGGGRGCLDGIRSLWNVLWVLESRFLKGHSLLSLHVPTLQTSLFTVVFGLLCIGTGIRRTTLMGTENGALIRRQDRVPTC